MDAEQLSLLHRIVLKLELERVADELDNRFDAARAEGKLDRVDELIRDLRVRHPYR